MSDGTRPKAAPRRKAGSKASRPKRNMTFRLVIEAQEMRVRYTPNWLGLGQAHFEFSSPHNPPRRIVISETGYRSHFAPMDEVKAAGGPQTYARELVLAHLNAGRARPAQGPSQMALF